jgi:lysophospholipase L1-like esterase
VFISLFLIAEICCRIYRDGFTGTFLSLANEFVEVPYSNLGKHHWVIGDKELGYHLNPRMKGVNSRCVRDTEITVPKPRGVQRIIFLGDSVTWPKDGFVKFTRDSLKSRGDFEVINAGVPGYTSYQEVLFYKRYLVETEPDLVIWAYCLNDNHRFLHRFDKKARMLSTREAQRSLLGDSSWHRIVSRSYMLTGLHLAIYSITKKYKYQKSKFEWETRVDFNIAWNDSSWLNYERDLIKLKNVLDSQNANLAVIIFPFEPQLLFKDDQENYNYALKPQRKLLYLCEKYAVPCLDLYSIFAEKYSKGKRLYKDKIHLNEAGHTVVVDPILHFLSENDLLSFQKSSNK